MAKSSRKSGGGEAAAPPPAADAPRPAERTVRMQAVAASRPEVATVATPTATSTYMIPPQGPGAPTRLRIEGSPHSEARLNTAMKVLLDPAARESSSRVYSGQARNWRR
jgi:hypothetical protein